MIKKIETQKDRDEKAKRTQIIVSVVLVALFVLSSLGYAIMSNSGNSDASNSVVEYAGLKFVSSNGFWITEISGKAYYFSYLPNETSDVTISGNYSFADYYQKPAYGVNINSAASGLFNALDGITLRTQDACFAGITCANSDLPVKTCADNLIIFSEVNSNITSVSKVGNCTFISGDFFKGSDKLLYKLLNIQ